jgi:hypothetical protein
MPREKYRALAAPGASDKRPDIPAVDMLPSFLPKLSDSCCGFLRNGSMRIDRTAQFRFCKVVNPENPVNPVYPVPL